MSSPVPAPQVETEDKTTSASSSGNVSNEAPNLNTPVNILLVDDEPRNLDVLENILASPNYQLVRAQTADETLLALIQNDFAAIVLDIQMPVMTGFELAKLIKQRKRNQLIPIIFLTAYFHEDRDVLSAYDVGAVDYLTKPVNPQILRSKINVFAELFRTARALAISNSNLEQQVLRRQEAEEALRRANADLEIRVGERTASLTQANRDLRASEERYRLILENALEYAIFTIDREGWITSWNAGARRVLEFEEKDILGKRLDVIFTAEDRARGLLGLEMGRALMNGKTQHEHWHLRKDGSRFWGSGMLMTLKDENGQHLGFLKILGDRTAHMRAEQQLREAEILRASEREQIRISQDLHDGLGQQLAGISCLSDTLKNDLSKKASPQAAQASRISELLNVAVAQIRILARGLQPVIPEPNGLMSALEDLAAHVTDLFKVSCRFECSRPVLIEDNAAATHFYRIAQEAVTNAIKHGRARNIKIELSSTSKQIILTISDDGAGFKPGAKGESGLGLRIMNHRAGILGATLTIKNKHDVGTELVCTMEKAVKHHH